MPFARACRRSLAWIALVLLAGASADRAGAHDFWIELDRATLEGPGLVRATLLIGHDGETEAYPRTEAHLDRFWMIAPDPSDPTGWATRDVPGRVGASPAGFVQCRDAGTHVIAYRSTFRRIEMPAARFEAYLAHEGLESIIQRRALDGTSDAPGRERYARAAKAICTVGPVRDVDRAMVTKPVGLPVEIVPLRHPVDVAAEGGVLPVRVLADGKPLAGVLVEAERRGSHADDHDHHQHHGHAHGSAHHHHHHHAHGGRTDADGRVDLPLDEAGRWVIALTHMVEADPSTGDEWESTWATLVVEVAAPSSAAAAEDEGKRSRSE